MTQCDTMSLSLGRFLLWMGSLTQDSVFCVREERRETIEKKNRIPKGQRPGQMRIDKTKRHGKKTKQRQYRITQGEGIEREPQVTNRKREEAQRELSTMRHRETPRNKGKRKEEKGTKRSDKKGRKKRIDQRVHQNDGTVVWQHQFCNTSNSVEPQCGQAETIANHAEK